MYKRKKKTTVQLTSLLDLLFVMIFVSLMQQKASDIEAKTPPAPKIVKQVKEVKPAPQRKRYSLQAVFTFGPTPSNPNTAKGSFLMAGKFETKSGAIRLGGISWIDRPKNYDMVPLSGEINSKIGLFKGRIDFQGCKTFTLKRTKEVQGSPAAGTWVGTYDCQQGETALTLEIE